MCVCVDDFTIKMKTYLHLMHQEMRFEHNELDVLQGWTNVTCDRRNEPWVPNRYTSEWLDFGLRWLEWLSSFRRRKCEKGRQPAAHHLCHRAHFTCQMRSDYAHHFNTLLNCWNTCNYSFQEEFLVHVVHTDSVQQNKFYSFRSISE